MIKDVIGCKGKWHSVWGSRSPASEPAFCGLWGCRNPSSLWRFSLSICYNPSPPTGLCASPRLSGRVLWKALQPSVRVSCSQGGFDAVKRYNMTFGIWAHVSECQGQGQPQGDWLWPVVWGWACQSNTSGWVVMLAAGREERKVLQKRKAVCLLLIFLWESPKVEERPQLEQ